MCLCVHDGSGHRSWVGLTILTHDLCAYYLKTSNSAKIAQERWAIARTGMADAGTAEAANGHNPGAAGEAHAI